MTVNDNSNGHAHNNSRVQRADKISEMNIICINDSLIQCKSRYVVSRNNMGGNGCVQQNEVHHYIHMRYKKYKSSFWQHCLCYCPHVRRQYVVIIFFPANKYANDCIKQPTWRYQWDISVNWTNITTWCWRYKKCTD